MTRQSTVGHHETLVKCHQQTSKTACILSQSEVPLDISLGIPEQATSLWRDSNFLWENEMAGLDDSHVPFQVCHPILLVQGFPEWFSADSLDP